MESARPVKRKPITLKRGAPDRLLPGNFFDVLAHRYFPVLSMTYIASVLGIASVHGQQGAGLVQTLLTDPSPYHLALFVALWVSVPAILWIILKGSILWSWYAEGWYKAVAFMMSSAAILAYILFPEDYFQGMRLFFVASIPVFFVQYFFFVKGGMPGLLAWPLTASALLLLGWGLLVQVWTA